MAHNITKHCEKCSRDFRVNNFAKHYETCLGPKIKKVRGVDYDPNCGYQQGIRKAWNKDQTKATNEIVAKAANTLKNRYSAGEIKPSGYCSAEHIASGKNVLAGRKSGGYRDGAGRGKKCYVEDSFGKRTCLQSTFELALAELLNANQVKWRREGTFKYDNRNYFPDFHLVDSDIYLDVKNDYLMKIDSDKIKRVQEQNPLIELYVFPLREAKSILESIGILKP